MTFPIISASILLEHWSPSEPRLIAAFPTIVAEALSSNMVADAMRWSGTIETSGYYDGLFVACKYAKPHIDSGFPQFSALWVLSAGGHVLGASSETPVDQRRDAFKRPRNRIEYPATQGDIVLLDISRLHWVLKADGPFVAFAMDFSEKPERAAVEKRLAIVCDNAHSAKEYRAP